MGNRRQDYRHSFDPAQAPHVELERSSDAACCTGWIADLSVEGMRICFEGSAPALAENERVVARFTLPVHPLQFSLNARVIHLKTESDGYSCGIHFVPSANLDLDARRERAIWQFLLDEQRRVLRKRRQEQR
jgi:c-di-GMP-binding flagellar brake protein YcgR